MRGGRKAEGHLHPLGEDPNQVNWTGKSTLTSHWQITSAGGRPRYENTTRKGLRKLRNINSEYDGVHLHREQGLLETLAIITLLKSVSDPGLKLCGPFKPSVSTTNQPNSEHWCTCFLLLTYRNALTLLHRDLDVEEDIFNFSKTSLEIFFLSLGNSTLTSHSVGTWLRKEDFFLNYPLFIYFCSTYTETLQFPRVFQGLNVL